MIHAQYAAVLFRHGRVDEAERLLREVMPALPPDSLRAVRMRIGFGQVLMAKGDAAGAERELTAALRACESQQAEDAQRAEAQVALGRVLVARGRIAEGRALLEQGLPRYAKWGLAHPDDVAAARNELAETRMSGTAP
jgi:hypothetical protein